MQLVDGPAFRFLLHLEFGVLGRAGMRGGHVHRRKTESLYVVSGRLHAVLVDTATADARTMELGVGDLITVEPGCAHVYIPLEHTQALEFSPELYEPDDVLPYDFEPWLRSLSGET